ncbi:ferredoxin [Streptomyces sp. NPDC004542]|jgi:ferredoxin|uniref:ferredoxin n=1 Tax=Streptomyces sp. NPDC004542 TaxID=3154281 RepID=UPI0033A70347
MLKIRVDMAKCEGFANCVMAAPDVFDIDDAGQVAILQAEAPEELREDVEEAVRACPVSALWVEAG